MSNCTKHLVDCLKVPQSVLCLSQSRERDYQCSVSDPLSLVKIRFFITHARRPRKVIALYLVLHQIVRVAQAVQSHVTCERQPTLFSAKCMNFFKVHTLRRNVIVVDLLRRRTPLEHVNMSELLEFVLLRIISTVEIIAPNEIICQNDLS